MDAESHVLGVRILGVNGIGLEAANPTICAGRDIPWLQDVAAEDVWTSWSVTYRDVVILDIDNRVIGVFNVTAKDLDDPTHYAALKERLTNAADLQQP